METLQFRDYIFRYNPQNIKVRQSSALTGHFLPGRGGTVLNQGENPRTIQCEGCFVGDSLSGALSQAAEFRRKTANGQAGTLFIPGMEPVQAYLKELALDLSGDGRIIPYTLVFMERDGFEGVGL